MEPAPRTILHVDLDAFFASVEQRDDPELRGKPVLVGGSTARGVVAAASYEARVYGVRSAMPMAEALRRCPQAVVVRHHMSRYAEASRGFFGILDDFSPEVESLSLDEAFLDVTGTERLLGDAVTIARSIKARVRDEIGLVASVGVAPSKFVAKIASDIDKPDGLRVVRPDDVLGFIHPLPVSRLWGVGAVTREKLAALGLRTIGDVARYPEAVLRRRLGDGPGAHLAALSRGVDARPVQARGAPVSIGHEETFEVDVNRREDLAAVLMGQADRVGARLRHAGLRAHTVQLKIKYADFRLVTRRRTLNDATVDSTVIGRCAVSLLDELAVDGGHGKRHRVRLCGVSVTGLEPRDAPRQLTMDEPARRRGEHLGDVLDEIHARFGDGLVRRAMHVPPDDDD
ncbi:DNA polymerase IV [Haliangium sp.]|uniref:DNA polymerase IV n=1 Tax=Haliangium sp. TaxID=2663208 RepID=UPI003D0C8584